MNSLMDNFEICRSCDFKTPDIAEKIIDSGLCDNLNIYDFKSYLYILDNLCYLYLTSNFTYSISFKGDANSHLLYIDFSDGNGSYSMFSNYSIRSLARGLESLVSTLEYGTTYPIDTCGLTNPVDDYFRNEVRICRSQLNTMHSFMSDSVKLQFESYEYLDSFSCIKGIFSTIVVRICDVVAHKKYCCSNFYIKQICESVMAICGEKIYNNYFNSVFKKKLQILLSTILI